MPTSLLGVLNMSTQSLANNQTALTVVSNNISNMNNSTYSKQSVKLNAIPGYDTYNWCSSIGSLQIGHGAEITAIQRNRAQWLDNYYREQNTSYGYYNQLGSMANNIENMLNNELSSTGLQKKLSDFFAASQSLSNEPTNNAYRIAYSKAAQAVADELNSMSSTLNTLRTQAVGDINDPDSFESSQIKMNVDDLNKKLSMLADVNGKIAQSNASGSASNDLLDQRDALLDEISTMVPLTVTENENNTVNIIIDNKTVVKGGEQKLTLQAVQTTDDDNPVKIQLVDKDGNVKSDDISGSLKSGSLKAIMEMGGTDELSYKFVLNKLDEIANAFAAEMNNIQTGVLNIDGVTTDAYCLSADGKTLVKSTTNMFVSKDGNPINAGNIKVNDAIMDDPHLIAAARGDNTLDGSSAIGNTKNMDLFNKLEGTPLAGLSYMGVVGSNQTLSDFITSLVSDIGSKLQNVKTSATSQKSVVEQAASSRGAYTGVNLNEELSDLIKYQRSYEASARVFNAASELMKLLTQLGA